MRLRSAFGVACLAVFMLGTVSGASALLPTFLVETGSLPVKFEGSAGQTKLEFASEVPVKLECTNVKVAGEVTSAHAGTYKLAFERCETTFGLECHTTGDAKGVLLWSGEFHLVRVALSPTKVGMLMSLPATTSSCLGEFTTHESKGFVLPITPINTFTKSFALTDSQAAGIQAFTSYYNEAGTLISGAYLLLESFPPKQFALESTTGISLTMERKSEIQA